MVTRICKIKGIDLLLDILPILCNQHLKLHFTIAGDGPLRPLFVNVIEKFNLKSWVDLLGMVPNHKIRDVLLQG